MHKILCLFITQPKGESSLQRWGTCRPTFVFTLACVRVCGCLINDDMWQTFDVNSVNVNLNINDLSPRCQLAHMQINDSVLPQISSTLLVT